MVTCQSANQLKTPAKVSRAFKMVSRFGSLGYTIMGKTADLTVVQKTIIGTLHWGGISHKHSLPKKLAVHRVLYPSMLTESWVEGKSVEEKDAQPAWENHSLMRIVKQNRFKNLGELHNEWTEAGVKAIKSHHTQTCQGIWLQLVIRGVLPGLRTGLLSSGPKSSFQMRASFVFHLETKVLESGGRVEKLIAQVAWSSSVKFPQSVMIWGAMSSAGVGPFCFFENQCHCTRLPRHFGALHASFCWPAF